MDTHPLASGHVEHYLSDHLAGGALFARSGTGLIFDGVDLGALAAVVGTPAYAYSATGIETRFRYLTDLFRTQEIRPLIAYAIKANDTLATLALLGELGAGADVVSEGELHRALRAGIPAERIVFSGVGKTAGEHQLALELGIRQVNVESREEFRQLVKVAASLERPAPVALRINPDVDAKTLAQITTGTRDNKFGMPVPEAVELARLLHHSPLVHFRGLSVHIGSQITQLAPYVAAFECVGAAVEQLRGLGVEVPAVDLGGGFGIPYRDGEELDMVGYSELAASFAKRFRVEIIIEPGRWLVGPPGILLTRVIYEKQQIGKRFVVVDAGMNDLIRPAFYGAYHAIVPVRNAPGPQSLVDVVGPVCESSDVLGKDRLLPDSLAAGDLLAILDAGAYGATMSSAYNTRPPPAAAIGTGEPLGAGKAPAKLRRAD